jgi:hypothetical protein
MAEVVLGDLSQVRIFDILKPLLIEKKTGKVVFRGKEEGEIYLELGNISHAKTTNSVGEYAFFTIMEWKAGKATTWTCAQASPLPHRKKTTKKSFSLRFTAGARLRLN